MRIILAGLIAVEGSAAYLRDTLDSENFVAVILKYHATTHSETLPILMFNDNDLCGMNGPTHVITNIKYGIGANFVFKKPASGKNKGDVLRDLKKAVMAIPTYKTEVDGHVQISNSIKETAKGLDVKLFSDFVIDDQPSNYMDSIHAFQDLPKRLGNAPDYASAAKMEMQLVPITRFCPNKNVLLSSISTKLVNKIILMLGELEATKQKANAIATSSYVERYQPIKKIIHKFMKEISVFELTLKSHLQTLIPNLRRAGSSEKKMITLFMEYTKSPFYSKTADAFLNNRRREVHMINHILDPTKLYGTGVNVVDPTESNDGKILFEKPLILILEFHILPREDIINKFLNGQYEGEREMWFNTPEIIAVMGKQFNKFLNFSSSNINATGIGYLLALSDAKERIITVSFKKNGRTITDNFIFPEQPPKLTLILNTYNSILFAVKKTRNPFVDGFSLKHWEYGRAESAIENKYKANNKEVSRVEDFDSSFDSEKIRPYKVEMSKETPKTVLYKKKNVPGGERKDSIPKKLYKFKQTSQIETNKVIPKEVYQNKYISIVEVNDLIPGEIYQFSIQYITPIGDSPSSPETLPIMTISCSPPENVVIEGISPNSFNIRWDTPLHVGGDKPVSGYKINVTGMYLVFYLFTYLLLLAFQECNKVDKTFTLGIMQYHQYNMVDEFHL